MLEELKMRIQDYKSVEKHLTKLGAKFSHEVYCIDTHFKTPTNQVIKIENDPSGNYFIELKLKNGKFQILKNEKIENIKKIKEELTKEYEIKRVIPKQRRFFHFKNYQIQVCIVENLGEFLIIEGENLAPEVIIKELKIKNPEFVTVSFDQLMR